MRQRINGWCPQIETVEEQTGNPDPSTNFRLIIIQTELERIKFLVRAYLQIRLAKVSTMLQSALYVKKNLSVLAVLASLLRIAPARCLSNPLPDRLQRESAPLLFGAAVPERSCCPAASALQCMLPCATATLAAEDRRQGRGRDQYGRGATSRCYGVCACNQGYDRCGGGAGHKYTAESPQRGCGCGQMECCQGVGTGWDLRIDLIKPQWS